MDWVAVIQAMRYGLAATLVLVAASGCAAKTTGPVANAAPTTASAPPDNSKSGEVATRPADAATDTAYYQERAAAFAKEALGEVEHTDFVRFRRGRLYLGESANAKATPESLQEALSAAFGKQDAAAVVDATTPILATDQADIRAHMLRAMALGKLDRSAEADFHRAVAIGLIDSIVHSGDGHTFKSAWTVFRVKEEYEIVKVLGGAVDSQALMSDGGQQFDVLDTHRVEGGQTLRVYFNITELFAEEARSLLGH